MRVAAYIRTGRHRHRLDQYRASRRPRVGIYVADREVVEGRNGPGSKDCTGHLVAGYPMSGLETA
eukprot:3940745-Rhodomonas_salina.5